MSVQSIVLLKIILKADNKNIHMLVIQVDITFDPLICQVITVIKDF